MEHEAHISVRRYFEIFVALMVLLALTVGAALLPFDRWNLAKFGIALALAIAIVKATLVVLYFMHVKVSSSLTKIFVCAGLVWFGILIVLTFSDYLTRQWLPYSRGWNDSPNIAAESDVPREK